MIVGLSGSSMPPQVVHVGRRHPLRRPAARALHPLARKSSVGLQLVPALRAEEFERHGEHPEWAISHPGYALAFANARTISVLRLPKKNLTAMGGWFLLWVGTTLATKHWYTVRRLQKRQPLQFRPWSLGMVVALLLGLLGLATAAYLLLDLSHGQAHVRLRFGHRIPPEP